MQQQKSRYYCLDQSRGGAGALLKTTWAKALIAIAAVAVVGTAVAVPVALSVAGTTTTTKTESTYYR